MDRLSSILPKVLRKRGLEDEMLASLVLYRARQWVSAHLTAYAAALTPSVFAGGVVIIRASQSAALQDCSHRSEELMAFLRSVLPTEVVVSGVRVVRA